MKLVFLIVTRAVSLLGLSRIWNQRHQMTVLREYEDFCNAHRPHRTLNQAA